MRKTNVGLVAAQIPETLMARLNHTKKSTGLSKSGIIINALLRYYNLEQEVLEAPQVQPETKSLVAEV